VRTGASYGLRECASNTSIHRNRTTKPFPTSKYQSDRAIAAW